MSIQLGRKLASMVASAWAQLRVGRTSAISRAGFNAAGLALAIGLAATLAAPRAAHAGCDGGAPTQTCTGSVPGGVAVTAPTVTDLEVNGLTGNVGGIISLTGGGANPGNAPDGGVYTCSPADASGCTIDPGSKSPPKPSTCTPNDSSHTCVPPAPSGTGPSGNAGPSVTVNVNTNGFSIIPGSGVVGVLGQSSGDQGGGGGNAYVAGNAGDGSPGADGGTVHVSVNGTVLTVNAAGVSAASIGGDGGTGGSVYGLGGNAGKGGQGGFGGAAYANLNGGAIYTSGQGAFGIGASSHGGNSGASGGGVALGIGGGGSQAAGQGELAFVQTAAGTYIQTDGELAPAVYAQSRGGAGASGGGGFGLFYGGGNSGGTGGNAGQAQIINGANILTIGNDSTGVLAESIGGAGGDGSTSAVLGAVAQWGSSGGVGGTGGVVSITNTGTVTTQGDASNAIEAESIGGGGGNGGNAIGAISFGGDGSGTTTGGAVTIGNSGTLYTNGIRSMGILAQSIGGGGGNGGSATGLFTGGGSGGSGANGDVVTVINSGSMFIGQNGGTAAIDSAGIYAQSVGGGGGNGGNAVGVGPLTIALGGTGGLAGNGEAVHVQVDHGNDLGSATAYSITTYGDVSDALFAQSIGGSGGNGGYSVTAAVGDPISIAIGHGGSGGGGGDSGAVDVTAKGWLSTFGQASDGLFAQSVGGGGGNGGASISLSGGAFAGAVSLGGTGGGGGSASTVTVNGQVNIYTQNANSVGLFAESLGGGGGNGGFAVSGSFGGVGVSAAIGGDGGGGGNGADVHVNNSGSVITMGDNSQGVFAESVGGGGGDGGFSVSASISAGAISAALGGGGGTAGTANSVNVNVDPGGQYFSVGPYGGGWSLLTEGKGSDGILAQSVGGGGGSGGFAGSLSIGGVVGVGVSLGGAGGPGNNSSDVNVTSSHNILTLGDNSSGIFAQSVGGGGGNGGFAIAISATLGGVIDVPSAAASVAIGGGGGSGGYAGNTEVDNSGKIQTVGNLSAGIVSQSIGGGGGNGGFAASGAITVGDGLAASVSIGGGGGTGNDAGTATLHNNGGDIVTTGQQSAGLFVQSVGGGGGNGGLAGSLSLNLGAGLGAAVGLGGDGAGAGVGKTATLTSSGSVLTTGTQSDGMIAQSIGGGGGNGGSTIDLSLSASAAVSVGLGGKGGSGGDGGSVIATVDGGGQTLSVGSYGSNWNLVTEGASSTGLLAQSVGGGGGNGGFAGTLAGGGYFGGSVALGGGGSGGGKGVDVTVTAGNSTFSENVLTLGANSPGILAQSVGGGGGTGGFAVSLSGSGGLDGVGGSASVSVGGGGGSGGIGGPVQLTSVGQIETVGDQSDGLISQSIGGRGGNGGFAVAASVNISGLAALSVGVGGQGAGGGDANTAETDFTGVILTKGAQSNGILTQSVGGGGGNGGFSVAGSLEIDGPLAASVSVGGGGATGGVGQQVTVNSNLGATLGTSATIQTLGADSNGIFAQSVGGGGGNGGFSGALSVNADDATNASIGVSVGGFGAGGGDGGVVHVTSVDNISTQGLGSNGILAQSMGGGGGSGGFSLAGSVSATSGSTSVSLSASVGGFGGTAGNAHEVDVTSTGMIQTEGDHANGVFAQSVGGGGGQGGFSAAAAFGLGSADTQNINLSASVGGFGGAAGNGGVVEVIRNGFISTAGNQSAGIFAQSIGGGGGDGGLSISGSMDFTPGASKNISGSLGGFGGAAGNGELVTVNSTGEITTKGTQSQAIFAQSIGGGGGAGGFSATGVAGVKGENTNFNLGISVGGFGGDAGTGGDVGVTNSGFLFTQGGNSQGILAQSIGGGGGAGGGSFSGVIGLTPSAAEGKSINAVIAVGGFGADGNISGAVSVDQSGGIVTWGDGSHGIDAESLGGGGGKGGQSNTLSLVFGQSCTLLLVCNPPATAQQGNYSAQISVGGFGGTGEDGNTVTVHNHDFIFTSGNIADGIFAQSVGGGGGEGGDGVVGLNGLVPPAATYGTLIFTPTSSVGFLKNLKVAVGGWGGEGGSGKQVQVFNSGYIHTGGLFSAGIWAQSLGGGGGTGGAADAGLTGTVGIGGGFLGGASSGDGGEVDVTNYSAGSIVTTGLVFAPGIFAQSVGAGGGVGGAGGGLVDLGGWGGSAGDGGVVNVTNNGFVQTGGLFSPGVWAESVGGGGGAGGGGSLSAVEVGGFAGATGAGQAVTVTNTGTVLTTGAESNGIQAQSIGGGGGAGGGSYDQSSITGTIKSFNLISIGGTGSSGGKGGTVDVENSGGIETDGVLSNGIFAQSVGGGGGSAGGGAGAVVIGLSSGAAGDGDLVTVNNYAGGNILTKSDLSAGIYAQSIGGGGGSAGATLGGVTWNQGGQGGGNGGDVIVDNSAMITTMGMNAPAIFAQSVGGGGGAVSSATGVVTVGGSGGTGGTGGHVTVNNAGTLMTMGSNSAGIFAQSVGGGGGLVNDSTGVWKFVGSAGGNGAAGNVDVTNSASISAPGGNSFAIMADSSGSTNGDVTVTLNGGVLVGGVSGGGGVGIFDGANNHLINNSAMLMSTALYGGYAIRAEYANDAVDNYDFVLGSVDLGGGANNFHNHQNARFDTGPVVFLGLGNPLLNDGYLQIGPSAPLLSQDLTAAQTTNLTGDFTQTSTGHMVVDISFGPYPSDLLAINGSANVAGLIDITLLKLTDDKPVTLITTTTGVTNSGVTAPGTLALTYTPTVVGKDLVLDLTPHFESPVIRPNAKSMGKYFDHVLDVGGAFGLNDLLLYLGELQDIGVYRRTIDLLSPEPYFAPYQAALFEGEDTANGVMSCHTTGSEYSAVSESSCGWMRATDKALDRKNTWSDFGFHDRSTGIQAGYQRAIDPHWRVGFAIGYDQHGITEDQVPAHGHGTFVTGAGVVKWENGPDLLAVSVAGGSGRFHEDRHIDVVAPPTALDRLGPDIATSSFDVSFITADFRAAHEFKLGAGYALPQLDVFVTNATLGAFTESGAGNIGSVSKGSSQLTVAIKPAVQFGVGAPTRWGVLGPYLKLGGAFRPDGGFEFPAAFVGSQPGAGTYTVKTKVDEMMGTVDGGFDLMKAGRWDINLGYQGEFGSQYKRQGARLKVSIPF